MSNLVNLFPVQSVAPLCAGKSFALYRETESNIYVLYINDMVDTEGLLTLRHTLNDIKSLWSKYQYDYLIKLNINDPAGVYRAYNILFNALYPHRDNLQAHIEYAYGYAALLAMLASQRSIDVNATFTLSFPFLAKKYGQEDANVAIWVNNLLRDKLPKENLMAIQSGRTIRLSVEELCNLGMVDYVYEDSKRISAMEYARQTTPVKIKK